MKVSLIIPAFNEENTIGRVIEIAKKVRTIDEIIVVNDGSSDNTKRVAESFGIKVISQKKNSGKGAAIVSGIKHTKGDILVFIDADLVNISPRKITALIHPILSDEADFTKAKFLRARGRVTELTVKPLLRVILPNVHFDQPLSGQFAAKRDFLEMIKIDRKWGVDIQLLFEAIKKGLRIKEVDIGKLIHKKQPIENLIIMSEQVIKTILEETGIIGKNYKLVAFDLDKTLILGSSIEIIARKLGFENELLSLRKKYSEGKIKDYEITANLARHFKGRNPEEIYGICKSIRVVRFAKDVIARLKKRQYKVAIISVAYSPVVEFFARLFGVDEFACPMLVVKNGKFTGEVDIEMRFNNQCCDHSICKREKLGEIAMKYGLSLEQCIAIGDGQSDRCMFKAAGLSISKGKKLNTDLCVKNLTEILVVVE